MKVLFATAELAPLVRVGGLAEAASGLARALRAGGVDVEVALPDYFSTVLANEQVTMIDGPSWVGPIGARRGELAGFGDVTLLQFAGIERPHAYVEPLTGQGWPDNDQRFFGFSAAVAALARERGVDLVHLNDWHTGAAAGMLPAHIKTVFSIHNLAYQGMTDGGWLGRFNEVHDNRTDTLRAYECYGAMNPLGGVLELADRIIAVSPHYAEEITTAEHGFGLDGVLRHRGAALSGILNGIDAGEWSPAADPHLPAPYGQLGAANSAANLAKQTCRHELLAEFGLDATGDGPVIGVVSRLVEQKGIDLLLDAAQYLASWNARLVVLGAGDPGLANALRSRAFADAATVGFKDGYDLGVAHRIFGGADLFVMPSRFEPCGLAQMQAMTYGTIPVTTSVGGLVDTVIDADADRVNGNGFRTAHVSGAGLVDALHRANQAWRSVPRRRKIIANGMKRDWSWTGPAERYAAVYRELLAS